jgi:hypothetical protein
MSPPIPARTKPKWTNWIRLGCLLTALPVIALLGYHLHCQYQREIDESNIAKLNEKVWAYQQKVGTLPDLNLIDLYHKGLTKERLHRTPFGGYYRLDPNQIVVYNPNLTTTNLSDR